MKGFNYSRHLAAVMLTILSLTLAACGGGDSASPPNVTGVYNGTITTGAGDSYPVEAAILGNRLLGFSTITDDTNVIFDFQLNVDSAGVVTGVSADIYETHKPDWEYVGHFSESPTLSGSAQQRVGVTIDFYSLVYGDDVQMVLTYDSENSGKSPRGIFDAMQANSEALFRLLPDPTGATSTPTLLIDPPTDPAFDYLLQAPGTAIDYHEIVMSTDEARGVMALTETVDIDFTSGPYVDKQFSGFLFAANYPASLWRIELAYVVTDGVYAFAAVIEEE